MAHVLIVDDDAPLREMARLVLEREGHAVRDVPTLSQALDDIAGPEALDVVLTDLRLGEEDGLVLPERVAEHRPDVPVLVMTGFATLQTAVAALRSGAYDYLMKPLELDRLTVAVERAAAHRELTREVHRLRRAVAVTGGELGMIGRSERMRETFDLVARAAESQATVLVSGESGTGKELVARAIHERSGRTGAFLAINCAAMPANLLESELFGHVRGAFTDARRARDGLFVEADGGTLFLDEIGELDLEMQPKLLRALQEKRVRPVGASREVSFDTRIVVATNRDLAQEIDEGNFREDLYYRVNVINVALPPLRARGRDVLLLAQHFIDRYARESGIEIEGLSDPAAERLLDHDWPGNVRELQNAMERAVALTRTSLLAVEDLPKTLRTERQRRGLFDATSPDEMPTLEQLERRYVRRVLDGSGGNKASAARVLGIDRRTLYRKLERWAEDEA
ncbi:MAG: sigma-54 dependent transcriptional regulator [Myxococcota bacterium]